MERRGPGAHELLFDTVFSDIADSRNTRYTPRIREVASRLLDNEQRSEEVSAYRALNHIIPRLWRTRMRIAPVFGGMIVTHELLRISRVFEGTAAGFVTTSSEGQNRLHAIEELLYGFSTEELNTVRDIMHENAIRSIGRERIESLLKLPGNTVGPHSEAAESAVDAERLLSDFKIRRRRAHARRAEGRNGPTEPLEEMLAAYLLKESIYSRFAPV